VSDQWTRRCEHYRVPRTLRTASFDGDPTESLKAARQFVDDELERGGVLMLLGQTGTGKTYSALAACRTLGDHWSFWYFPAWCAAMLDPDRRVGAREDAHAERLLVLDDFGAEYLKAGGLIETFVDELVWTREGNRLPTIITTNLTPDTLRARITDRIVDRLNAWGRIVQVVGPSLRQP
jgi:DNA replication protein DnaC